MPVNNLPKRLTYLRFGQTVSKSGRQAPSVRGGTTAAVLQESVRSNDLEFELPRAKATRFQQPLIDLPSSLETLIVGSDDYENLNSLCELPPLMKCVQFGTYDIELHPTRNLLPSTITHLRLPNSFNCPIQWMQNNTVIRVLSFGNAFNQPIDNVLPSCLTHLEFGTEYNHPVDTLLPNTLTYLAFSWGFNQPVDHLPPSLLQLRLGDAFDHNIDFLPPGLTHLGLTITKHDSYPLANLPNSLMCITLCIRADRMVNMTNIPASVSVKLELVIDSTLTKPLINVLFFPRTLTELRLHYTFNQPVDNLPAGLRKIHFCGVFNQPVTNLPISLEMLHFGFHFDQPLDHLPQGVWSIQVGYHFNQPLNHLPNELKYLAMNSEMFPHPFYNLPPRLRYLYVLKDAIHFHSLENIQKFIGVKCEVTNIYREQYFFT